MIPYSDTKKNGYNTYYQAGNELTDTTTTAFSETGESPGGAGDRG